MPWRQLHQTQCPCINSWYFWCLQMVKRTWSLDHPFYHDFFHILRYFWTSLTWPLPCPFQTPCSATRCLVPRGCFRSKRTSLLKRLRFNTFGAFHAAIEATERVGMSPTKTSVSHGCLQVYGQEWAFYRTPNPTSCGVCAAGLISHWEDQEVSLVF